MNDFDNNNYTAPTEPQQQQNTQQQYAQQQYAQQQYAQQQYAQQQYAQQQYAQPSYGRLPSGSKQKMVAGLLAIILGCLGVHKFYLGYTTSGVIMLLVTLVGGWLFGLGWGIMAVIGVIEGIVYLTKSEADFDAIYVLGEKPWF